MSSIHVVLRPDHVHVGERCEASLVVPAGALAKGAKVVVEAWSNIPVASL